MNLRQRIDMLESEHRVPVMPPKTAQEAYLRMLKGPVPHRPTTGVRYTPEEAYRYLHGTESDNAHA